MPLTFWLRRFFVIFLGAFVVLGTVYVLRGRPAKRAVAEAAVWSAAAATLFIATRLYHVSKGRRCEMCRDMPEPTSAKLKDGN